MKISEKLGKKFYSVLQENQLKMMELSGIDIKAYLAQQENMTSKMSSFAENFGDEHQKTARKTAEYHQEFVKANILHQKFPFSMFTCAPPLDQAVDSHANVTLAPLGDEAHAKGSATCDVAENTCRPYFQLHGMGSGIPVSGEVTCGLVFSKEGSDLAGGRYRIRALVQGNGYRLMQLWCGGCGSGATSNGHLRIVIRLYVSQLFNEVVSPDFVIFDSITGGYPDSSHINNTVDCWADLVHGSDVDIKVELQIEGDIDGWGQIFVDLQTSAYYYFKVPEITICRSIWPIFRMDSFDWRHRYIPPEKFLEKLKKDDPESGPDWI